MAQDAAPRKAAPSAPAARSGGIDLNELSQFLMSAGLATMGGTSMNAFQNIGRGGLVGLEYMQAARAENERKRKEMREEAQAARENQIIQDALNPNVGTPTLSPSKAAAAAAETVPSAEAAPAPVKVAAAKEVIPDSAATTAPKEEAPATGPVTPAAPEKKVAEEKPVEIAAEDKTPIISSETASREAEYNRLSNLHKRVMTAMPYVRDPHKSMALQRSLQGIEFEMQRIRDKVKEEEAAVQRQQTEQRQARHEKWVEEKESIPYQLKLEGKKEAMKAQPKKIAEISSADQKSQQILDDIKKVEKGYQTGKMHTSPIMESAVEAVQSGLRETKLPDALVNFLADPEKIENTQALQRLSIKELLDSIGGSLGNAISDADRATIQRMVLGLDKSKETNIALMKQMKGVIKRVKERKQFMNDYVAKNGWLDENYDTAEAAHFSKMPSPLNRPSNDEIQKELVKRRGENG